jgi:hypothetical protein
MHRPARTLLLVAALSTACASADRARRAELRRGLDEARVPRSPAELWPEVQRFVYERGYPLVGDDRLAVGRPAQSGLGKLFSPGFQTKVRDDGSRVLETDPLGSTRTRVRAEARAVEGGATQLRVRLVTQSDVNPIEQTEWRDEDLELALLERVDPAAAARVQGKPAPQAAAAAPAADGWSPVRPLVGTWVGALPDGVPVRWRFEFAGDARFLEVHGTPLLFAGPAGPRPTGEEMGRISRAPAGDRLVWNQFTVDGRVDRYESAEGATATSPELVFVANAPESLPAGTRVRLALRRDGGALVAALAFAEPGKDFAPAREVRLKRPPE